MMCLHDLQRITSACNRSFSSRVRKERKGKRHPEFLYWIPPVVPLVIIVLLNVQQLSSLSEIFILYLSVSKIRSY